MSASSESLGLLVEFSIGLAGFSAIVSVFLQRSSQLSALDRFRIFNLLLLALLPAFIVFTCIGFESILADLDLAVRISSAVLAGCLLIFVISIPGRLKRLPSDQRELIRTGAFLFLLVAVAGNIIAQTLSSITLEGGVAFGTLFFGLSVILLQGVIQFIWIIIARPTDAA